MRAGWTSLATILAAGKAVAIAMFQAPERGVISWEPVRPRPSSGWRIALAIWAVVLVGVVAVRRHLARWKRGIPSEMISLNIEKPPPGDTPKLDR